MSRRFIVNVDGLDEPVLVEVLEETNRDTGTVARVRVGSPEAEPDELTEMTLDLADLREGRFLVKSGQHANLVDVLSTRTGYAVLDNQASLNLTVADERDTWLGAGGASDGEGVVTVAMPGKVVTVDVEEGQAVTRGERLLIIEAMKMENDVKAPRDGVVKAIRVAPGDAVEAGQALVELE